METREQTTEGRTVGPVGRLRRFMSYPPHDKVLAIAVRWRKWFPGLPFPIRLRFGAWWLVKRSKLDEFLLWHEGFEQPEFRFVERFLAPGMCVLDIGAHHGLYTLLASKLVGESGSVIAFEPSPREGKRLTQHVRLNLRSNVRIAKLALGSADGGGELFVVDGPEDYCNSLRPPAVEGNTSKVLVDVVRLDDFLIRARVRTVDFVKLDVEGAELEVIRGANKLLNTPPRPVLLVEVEDIRARQWGYRAREIVRALERLEFEWFQPLPDGGLSEISTSQETFAGTLAAVPRERRGEVLSRLGPAC